jgi:hypothetical protein
VRLATLLRRTPPRDREAVERIKAVALLALGDGSSVTVSEIACPDPGCPDLETAILIMHPDSKTRAVKIRKPIAAVTEQDVREALDSREAERASGLKLTSGPSNEADTQ